MLQQCVDIKRYVIKVQLYPETSHGAEMNPEVSVEQEVFAVLDEDGGGWKVWQPDAYKEGGYCVTASDRMAAILSSLHRRHCHPA